MNRRREVDRLAQVLKEKASLATCLENENELLKRRYKMAELRTLNAAIHLETLKGQGNDSSLNFPPPLKPVSLSHLPKLPDSPDEFRCTYNTFMAEVLDTLSLAELCSSSAPRNKPDDLDHEAAGVQGRISDLDLRIGSWIGLTVAHRQQSVFFPCQV